MKRTVQPALCHARAAQPAVLRCALQLMREYEEDPSSWAEPGPTRATAIVACLPAFMDASGHSTGGAAPMQRGASLATTQHMDPAAAPIAGNLSNTVERHPGRAPGIESA